MFKTGIEDADNSTARHYQNMNGEFQVEVKEYCDPTEFWIHNHVFGEDEEHLAEALAKSVRESDKALNPDHWFCA